MKKIRTLPKQVTGSAKRAAPKGVRKGASAAQRILVQLKDQTALELRHGQDGAMIEVLSRALEIAQIAYDDSCVNYSEMSLAYTSLRAERDALAKRNKGLEEQLDTLSNYVLALHENRTMNMMEVVKW